MAAWQLTNRRNVGFYGKLIRRIIIGSGPAGLSAAIYAKRAKLSSLTIEANFASGGQVLNTYEVDNYPGLPASAAWISEARCAHTLKKWARNFPASV